MSDIPSKAIVGPDQEWPVIQCDLKGPYGQVDLSKGEIRIDENSPNAGKHVTLLHELLHVADHKNVQAGIYKKCLTENQITHLAGGLFPMLVMSGLWQGVSGEELFAFFRAEASDTELG